MNKYDEYNQPHGYWESPHLNVNYHHGLLHGKYESYWDKSKTIPTLRGNLNMGEDIGYWEFFNSGGDLVLKSFYL